MFEVKFRGMNSFEAGRKVPAEHGELRAWEPAAGMGFECDESSAKLRFKELLDDGIAGRMVDGVIPHVVAIDELHAFTLDGERLTVPYTRLWAYTDPDEPLNGTWADVGNAS